jgi:hypothetical protein
MHNYCWFRRSSFRIYIRTYFTSLERSPKRLDHPFVFKSDETHYEPILYDVRYIFCEPKLHYIILSLAYHTPRM